MSKINKKIKVIISSIMIMSLVGCSKPTKDTVIKDLDENNYSNFAKDYKQLSEEDKKVVDKKLSQELEYITKEFIKNEYSKESLDESIKNMNLLKTEQNETSINEVISKLNELYDVSQESIVAYESGIDYLNKKEYEKALEKFNEVSDSHPIYKEAQKSIQTANRELEKTKPAPVEVTNVRLSRNIIDNQLANVQFTNKSDKVIKEVQFSVFGYDKNGYPVKVQFNNDEYLNCKLDKTLQPGESSDPEWGWDLYNEAAEITELKVSVKRVDFYEDDAWENYMYNSDVEKYSGNPIK